MYSQKLAKYTKHFRMKMMDFQALILDTGKYYNCLLTFNMIMYSVHFDDSTNQHVVSKLIKEVQATNPSFQACQIRGK